MGFYANDCPSHYTRKKGKWERVAFVYDRAARTHTIVVNGVTMDKCGGRAAFTGTGIVYLGKLGTTNSNWHGQIKNVKIFNVALSPDKIENAMRGNYGCVPGIV